MKKNFLLFICFGLIFFSQIALAQKPTASTAENPIWYYIQVVGGDASRTGRVFTTVNNDVYGSALYEGKDSQTQSCQLWRFEASGSEYVIINKQTNKKLSLEWNTTKGIAAAIVTSTPASTWKIIANSGSYNITATSPLSSYSKYKYAHQMNESSNRNYSIGFEEEKWKSDKNSLFKFIQYEDPNPIISDQNNIKWYYISTMKSGYEGMCITATQNTTPLKFSIEPKVQNNDFQQWKLIKKEGTDSQILFVNKATNNVIQTKVEYNEYYYTQSTSNYNTSNGWELDYIGKKQFKISGTHEDEKYVRYLNASSSSEPTEIYIEGQLQSSGYAWLFEEVESAQFPGSSSLDNLFLTSLLTQSEAIENLPSDTKYIPSDGSASSYQNGEDITKSYDGNMNTLYHSSYASTKFPVTLTYNFTDVPQLDYLVYHPRNEGSNGIFKELEIWYTTEGNAKKKLGDYNFQGSSTSTTVSFNTPIIKPTEIEFIIKSGTGNFASCAEMEFYCYNPETNYTHELFEDQLLTKLKSSTTLNDIKNISIPYIRDMAMSIYKKQYSLEYRNNEYKAYLNMTEFSKLTNITTYSKYENPTGIYFPKGKHVIMVENIKNTPVHLLIPKYENQTPENWSLPSRKFALHNGLNIIDIGDWDGLGYISFYSNKPEDEEPVKIHILNGVVQGYFDSAKHTNEDWVRLLKNANKYIIMDMVGTYSQIAFPVDAYKTYAPQKGVELISAYDTIVKYEQRFYGYEKYNKQIKNRVLWRVNYSYYAYKDDNGCSFQNTYMSAFANPNRLNIMSNYEGWTIPHELGHVHQFNYFNWHGMTEVTVNLPNFYLQHQLKYTSSRFPTSVYKNAYNDIVVPHIAHASYFGDNYNYKKGVVFAQLYHYFAEQGNEDFYPDLFEALRKTGANTSNWTMADYEINFVKKACEVSQVNLIPFFEKWGFFYYTNADSRSPFNVEDYGGNKIYSLTKAKVDKFKEEIAAKKYAEPDEDITLVLPNKGRIKPLVGMDDIQISDYKIYAREGYIIVEGTDNYTIRNISGIVVDSHSSLPTGVYMITIGEKTAKILVE